MTNYTIYRYPVKLNSNMLRGKETALVPMPAGAKVLSVGLCEWRPREISIWCLVEVDPIASCTKNMEIMVLGTGHATISDDLLGKLRVMGTVVCNSNEEVYHVFEVTKQPRYVG